MKQAAFALKGDILYTSEKMEFVSRPDSYLVCEDGQVAGVFGTLPERFAGIQVEDYSGKLVIPGMCDLHLHAPQYAFRGLGMDLELLDWLNSRTFREEARYAELDYARRAYGIFCEDLAKSPTTRICAFATIHREATALLMELLDRSGAVKGFVGKVNMDRNSPDYLRETTEDSLAQTARWLEETSGRFQNIAPMLTPRFTPSCTDGLMEGLGRLQRETGAPVQSHLSENFSEIAWVRELCPGTRHYGDSYDRWGLFGGSGVPTVMAHCVHSSEEETALMRERGVYIAFCPQSNTNLRSGVAPVKRYISQGLHVGMGTDLAGGANISMLRAMADGIQASKLRWRLQDDSHGWLTVPEAFYLATRGGGAFFGRVGAFEEGFAFDAVVLDDSGLRTTLALSPEERLERMLYLAGEQTVAAKYLAGERVPS